tara:strand:- start:53 stop:253 length:201 start_codon:yes stop_codon:yes gene_type:complete
MIHQINSNITDAEIEEATEDLIFKHTVFSNLKYRDAIKASIVTSNELASITGQALWYRVNTYLKTM